MSSFPFSTRQCNLNCSYCFFLKKEALYPGSRFRMTDEVLETYIRQLIEYHNTPQVTVAWQGGEPTLMGLDFYRRALEYQGRYKKPGMVFEPPPIPGPRCWANPGAGSRNTTTS
jgi:uncharacterized protein